MTPTRSGVIFVAANQRLRRAIMNEKCRDAGYMRQLHNAAASHAIFMAANQRLRRAIMNENGVAARAGLSEPRDGRSW